MGRIYRFEIMLASLLYNKHGIKKEEYTSPNNKVATPLKRRKIHNSGIAAQSSGQSANQITINATGQPNNPGLVSPRNAQKPHKSIMNIIFKSVLDAPDHEDKGRKLSEHFMKLPSKSEYPDYYKVIERPIGWG